MYLKKLEIQGFKSFAAKTVLEFEPGITSVVGPNGSGKSNIADSLRWVFGEQSMKLLRSKVASDVIFAGSDLKARLGACEVMVYFDNTDHKMPIAYEEVMVGRRLYRTGNSEYLINGTGVRLLDIEELLLKSGFGNTSYCVIGQGMIDQLILGGPGAVKEMIEEAAGIKPYYFKRERTLRRLERTETNLNQVKALVSEIEPRLKSLRRQAKKLERRAAIESELRTSHILYFREQFRGFEIQTAEIKSKEEVFDKQVSALQSEIERLTEDIESEERDLVSSESGQKNLQKALPELYRAKHELLEEQVKTAGKIEAIRLAGPSAPKLSWVALKDKFSHAYLRLRSLVKKFANFDTRIETLKKEIQETEKLFENIWLELQEDLGNHQQAEEEKKLEERLKVLRKEIGTADAQISHTEKKLQEEQTQSESRKSQLFVKDRLLRNKQETLVKTRDAKNQLAVEMAKLVTRKEVAVGEAKNELGQNFQEVLAGFETRAASPTGLVEKIAVLKKQLMDIGGVDDLVQKEYEETEQRFQYLISQSNDLDKAIKDLKTVIAELDEIIKKQFDEAFGKISEKFSEYFRTLFSGGRATMSLVRAKPSIEEEVEEESDPPRGGERESAEVTGIEIRATPPGKRLGGIAALSGGERALTSIALLCSLLSAYPSPFVVLDEVDAALDEANSVRFGKILGTLAHRTQFITITHNRETMRQSHTLYGVTMRDDGVSKILSLKLQEAAVYSTKN